MEEIKAMMSSPEFNINQRSKAGKTGLMHAAKQGEKATVLQLVTDLMFQSLPVTIHQLVNGLVP